MNYETYIGFRYLKSKKQRRSISVLSWISIAGVMLGVTTLCTALSVMNGFEKEILDKMIGANAHAVVYRLSAGKFTDYEEVRKKLISVSGVKSAAPIVLGEAMLTSGNRVAGVAVKGIDLRFPQHYRGLEQTKVGEQGKISELLPQPKNPLPGIAIGKILAERLGVKYGDIVTLVSPLSFFGLEQRGGASRRQFQVRLIFSLGMYQYDAKFCFIDFQTAQQFFQIEGAASAIEFFVSDFNQLGRIKFSVLQKLGGFPFRVQDWRQQNYPIFKAIEQNKFALSIILLCIILVASLNIAGTLILMVLEKSREIAILRAMGAKRRSIMSIFIYYGLYIGAMGTILGLGLGLVVSSLIERIGIGLDSSIYFISRLPIKINPLEWLAVALASILISFFASLLPSLKATEKEPIEILRYN